MENTQNLRWSFKNLLFHDMISLQQNVIFGLCFVRIQKKWYKPIRFLCTTKTKHPLFCFPPRKKCFQAFWNTYTKLKFHESNVSSTRLLPRRKNSCSPFRGLWYQYELHAYHQSRRTFFFSLESMTLPIRTLTTIAGLGLTGAGGYYYGSNIKKQQPVLETPIPVTTEKKQNYSLLDPKEIDDRLRSGQFSNKLNLDYIKATYTNQLPSNDPVEDNFSINTFQNGLIAGVYDGN